MYDLSNNDRNGAGPNSPSETAARTATIVEGLVGPMPDALGRALAVGLMHPVATRQADLRSMYQLVAI